MKRRILYVLLSAVLLLAWQFFGSLNQTVRLLISSPSLVVQFLADNAGDLLVATQVTLLEAVAGLCIATTFSFAMMILCFYRPSLMDFILPIMVSSQVVPLIVLAPFFIILFGLGVSSKIAMAALMSFFPIFVSFAQGYRSISSNLHELMHIYNVPLRLRIRHVYFPLSTSSIMSGLKVSATLAVIGAIVAEFNGAESGLGKNLFLSAKRLEPDLMMASLLLSSVLGGGLYIAINTIEKKVGSWYLQ
jgi:NitT/TauT family transport system permease protein